MYYENKTKLVVMNNICGITLIVWMVWLNWNWKIGMRFVGWNLAGSAYWCEWMEIPLLACDGQVISLIPGFLRWYWSDEYYTARVRVPWLQKKFILLVWVDGNPPPQILACDGLVISLIPGFRRWYWSDKYYTARVRVPWLQKRFPAGVMIMGMARVKWKNIF